MRILFDDLAKSEAWSKLSRQTLISFYSLKRFCSFNLFPPLLGMTHLICPKSAFCALSEYGRVYTLPWHSYDVWSYNTFRDIYLLLLSFYSFYKFCLILALFFSSSGGTSFIDAVYCSLMSHVLIILLDGMKLHEITGSNLVRVDAWTIYLKIEALKSYQVQER